MRTLGSLLALSCAMVAAPARAGTAALVIEVVGSESIGVRVFSSKAPTHCEGPGAIPLIEAVVSPGKPLVVESDAQYFCVMRTFAPFTKVGWTNPLTVTHLAGTAARHLSFLARIDGTPPKTPVAPAPVAPPAGVTPLVVELTGGQKIGVRIAAGTVSPCTSPDNQPLFTGVPIANESFTLATTAACVCVQQTSAPFVAVGWNEGRIVCRPTRRVGKRLLMDFTAPWSVAIDSHGP